jgi:flagellar biosynthetic protein FliS
MHKKYAQSAYKANNVSSLPPGEQIARLMEKGVSYIKQAKDHVLAKQYEARYNETEKCMTLITGLMSCLDRNSATDQMCDVLENYYQFLQTMLAKININNDPQICDAVIDSMTTMADTWRQIQKVCEKGED